MAGRPDVHAAGSPDVAALLATVIAQGPSGNAELVFDYEDAVAAHFRAPWAISVSSGTAAIHAALLALGVGPGDDVVLPCTAPSMSLLPIVAVGATPVMCDVRSSRSFGLSPDDLRAILGPRTRAALYVPMWGYWDEAPETPRLLRARGVPALLDASQAHHLRVGGRPLTDLADAVCLSTHARKPLSTGEGGLVLTDSEGLAAAVRSVRTFGQRAVRQGHRIVATGPFGASFGMNLKLNGLGAALGLANLSTLEQDFARRRAVATVLRTAIASAPSAREQRSAPDAEIGLYGFCFSVSGMHRSRIAAAVDDLIEVETERYDYDVLSRTLVASPYRRPCPNAQALVRSLCSLRLHGVTVRDARRVGHRLADALGRSRARHVSGAHR